VPSWRIQHVVGDAAAFHARDLPAHERVATFFSAESSTLVLGSSQPSESVNEDAAARLGIDIIRRRSGGGGVLLLPGEYVWLDLEIPADDRLWSDDVGRAMWWVGEMWRAALAELEPQSVVYQGRLQRTPWSKDVCFAGAGPGEVMVGGAKLVGISQRRTRRAARFQTMIHLAWRPEIVAALVAAGPAAAELAPVVRTTSASLDEITAPLTAALTQHTV
jgi:lipoate-protein ligase A